MIVASRHDAWGAGNSYDRYMGRWIGRIAPVFLDWLAMPAGLDWLEVGCGTSALSAAIIERAEPQSLIAVDPSPGFIDAARTKVVDRRATFQIGDAQALDI